MRVRRGFSIVELLVVIGMIAILMSILMPLVGRIHQMAARTSCQGQMRQLTLAALNYAVDNQEQLPYCNWQSNVNTGGIYGCGWLFSLPAYRPSTGPLSGAWSTTTPPIAGVQTGVLWPYTQNLAIYHCPVDSPEFWSGTEFLTSYLMNGAQCRYGNCPSNTPGLRLGQFKYPSTSVLFWEALEQQFMGQNNSGAVWNDGSSFPTEENISARHLIGANVSCLDGHVEWWDKPTWVMWAQTPPRVNNRLWCNPATADGSPG